MGIVTVMECHRQRFIRRSTRALPTLGTLLVQMMDALHTANCQPAQSSPHTHILTRTPQSFCVCLGTTGRCCYPGESISLCLYSLEVTEMSYGLGFGGGGCCFGSRAAVSRHHLSHGILLGISKCDVCCLSYEPTLLRERERERFPGRTSRDRTFQGASQGFCLT